MQKIKFFDIYKSLKNKSKFSSLINNYIKKNKFVGGAEVENFEKNFAKYIKIKYACTTANGTDSLEIAIKSLNLPKNSEVIVPVNTWISTAEAVIANDLKIKFCDINLNDYTICIKDLEKKINKKTKLIIPVHLYGNPCDMYSILKIAKINQCYVLEDCAQAHQTLYKNKHVGTFGDVSSFSFFPGKNLGAFGDGGGIVTNSKKIDIYCRRFKNHGSLKKYDHMMSGRNSRLDTIQAGILSIRLRSLKSNIKKRNNLAKIYYKKLKKNKFINLYNLKKTNYSSYHQFVIRFNNKKIRDGLRQFLSKRGIETMIHYPYMLNNLKFFKKYYSNCPNSHNLGDKILSLPITEDHSQKEIEYICKNIENYFSK